MSIDHSKIVDVISTSPDGKVKLTISDHHAWAEPFHLKLLQDKLNSYLQFIECGQIFEDYPDANGKEIIISIMMKDEPNLPGMSFLQQAKEIITKAGFDLEWKTLVTND